MNAPLRIGIAGLGTVAGGVVRLIADNRDLILERSGREIEICAVSARSRTKERGLALNGAAWLDDARDLAALPDLDVVVELIGGADGVARDLVEAALAGGKHVVTANKALLARHGTALARMADAARVSLNYEAAVAGGVPIVKALRESLAANRIERVFGILNGTCNYILTRMEATGSPLEEALSEAQRLGYAEADPSFDIGGLDTAHKLSILASLAFNASVTPEHIHVEGIQNVSALDIRFAREFGYRIKLLGIASRTEDGLELRVHPCMVPLNTPIADVDGVLNAVVAEGNFVGQTVYEGRGAGAEPTASAVVADLIDIARGVRVPALGVIGDRLAACVPVPMDRHFGAYYVRFSVLDQPGVLAAISAALAREQVSIDSLLQRGRAPGEQVSVVMTTHETREAAMRRALDEIAGFPTIVERPHVIRIEKREA